MCIHYCGVEIICPQLATTGFSERLISMSVQVSHRNNRHGGFETDMNLSAHVLFSIPSFIVLLFFLFALVFKAELIFTQRQMMNYGCADKLVSVTITRKEKERGNTERRPSRSNVCGLLV